MKIDERKQSPRTMFPRPFLYLLAMILCLVWFAGDACAERASGPAEKKQGLSEMDRLAQEKNDVRQARLKLLQDEGTYQVQYFKPVDRLRRQLDLEESDLYAECSNGKDLKAPKHGFCIAELNRFNDNVKYYNERVDALKAGLVGHKQEFAAKMDDLDKKEREIDRKITLLKEKKQR